VRELRSAGKEAWLHLPELAGVGPGSGGNFPEEAIPPGARALLGDFDLRFLVGDPRAKTWNLVALDRFRTPAEEYRRWAQLAPVIGVDEGGPARDDFDFLIDILPGLPGRTAPNVASPALLPPPKNRRSPGFPPPAGLVRVLVSFGAEDSAGLALPLARALAVPGTAVTLIAPGFGKEGANGEAGGVRTLPGVPELREHLAEYDLVLTHFGLTAFECLRAGTAALLASPTPYHEALARKAGFVSLGTGKGALKNIKPYVRDGEFDPRRLKILGERCRNLARIHGLDGEPRSLGALIGGFDPRFPRACPVCGGGGRAAGRFPQRTYRRCSRCGTVYMLRSGPPPVEYGEDYFFGAYKNQYGKTYLEDFPNLVQAARTRLSRITRLLPNGSFGLPNGSAGLPRKGRLLDIGCAYGPFLAAAGEAGFSPQGIDPAAPAVRYVRETLKIPAEEGFFPDPPPALEDESFDAVSLWYVLEHFEDPRRALREIYRILRPGGVLAFSTPSFSGISRRRSPGGFLERSPPDHWTIWTPRRCGKILAGFGFKVKKIVITGHHPERFGPLFPRKEPPGWAYSLLYGISRIFGLGDTFELYAVKMKRG
jgi:SAM-dependent methyltransferase